MERLRVSGPIKDVKGTGVLSGVKRRARHSPRDSVDVLARVVAEALALNLRALTMR
jgi:hypothetical protein